MGRSKHGRGSEALPPIYLFAAAITTAVIDDGGPGWLNLVALPCIWNAMKFAWMGLVSPLMLLRGRVPFVRTSFAVPTTGFVADPV